jgi:hypothetical protein
MDLNMRMLAKPAIWPAWTQIKDRNRGYVVELWLADSISINKVTKNMFHTTLTL